ncbi:hypothetical protein ACS0TY_015299 [Phlomoides rotata]
MKSGFTRMKRVTDPLDDKAKARIVGREGTVPDYVSSGSECSDVMTSPSLSELFFGFNVGDAGETSPESGDSDCDRDWSLNDSNCANFDSIEPILQDQRDAYKNVLRAQVSKSVDIFSCVRSNKEMVRRNVMACLRNFGYNAAICKTKWESSGGLSAGNYEFIDVLRSEFSTRYIVDLDFAAEFEIARPTNSYDRLMQQLPRIFVGTSEDLKQVLKVVSDAARRSLKSRGLHLPPWRKHRFMQNKWLGPYRRSTNILPASFSSSTPAKPSYGVKCRAVGFDASFNGSHLMSPATARTR